MRRRLAIAVAIMLACMFAATTVYARHHHHRTGQQVAALDASGNFAGLVISKKTGARARVSGSYASLFQSYIDDIEARGGVVRFMGGIRPGHCSSSSMHPCGRALDVCQTGRGRVDARCHLPSRHELARIAEAHGLFEGGRWCHSDYGHAQVGVSAGDCGTRLARSQHRDVITVSARTRYQRVRMTANPAVDRLTQVY